MGWLIQIDILNIRKVDSHSDILSVSAYAENEIVFSDSDYDAFQVASVKAIDIHPSSDPCPGLPAKPLNSTIHGISSPSFSSGIVHSMKRRTSLIEIKGEGN